MNAATQTHSASGRLPPWLVYGALVVGLLTTVPLLALSRDPACDTRGHWMVAGILCAAASLTRAAGLPLLLAFSIERARRGRRVGVLPLACGWSPVLGWQAARHVMAFDASYLDNALNASGLTAGTRLARLRKLEADAIHVAGYLALIILRPYPRHVRRFLFVLLPIVLGDALVGLVQGARRLPQEPRRWVLFALPSAAVVLFASPSTALMVTEIGRGGQGVAARVARSPARHLVASPHAAIVHEEAFEPVRELLARARASLLADAWMMSPIPELTLFLVRREVGDMARFRTDPLDGLRDCPYVLMVAFRNFPDSGLPPCSLTNRCEVRSVSSMPRRAR